MLLFLLTGAFFIGLIEKYIFRKKDPNIEELWLELDKEEWFQNLLRNPEVRSWITADKENGLLKDPYYVRKILEKELHREGFVKYLQEKTGDSKGSSAS
jgi:hypothetical protein